MIFLLLKCKIISERGVFVHSRRRCETTDYVRPIHIGGSISIRIYQGETIRLARLYRASIVQVRVSCQRHRCASALDQHNAIACQAGRISATVYVQQGPVALLVEIYIDYLAGSGGGI